MEENNRKQKQIRLEPGCNEGGGKRKRKRESTQKQNGDCRRRLRGVYDLF